MYNVLARDWSVRCARAKRGEADKNRLELQEKLDLITFIIILIDQALATKQQEIHIARFRLGRAYIT